MSRYDKKCYLHLLLAIQKINCVIKISFHRCDEFILSSALSSVVEDMGASRIVAADKHELAEADWRARSLAATAYCLLFGTIISIAV